MKITEYGPIRPASDIKKRKTGSAASSQFADMLEALSDGAEAVSSASALSPATPVDTMLALQEISEEEVQRKKLMQQGKNLVDELDNLRKQLLGGGVPLSTLQNLGRQLSIQKQSVNDPALLALMDEIELRAAVELAKLEKARDNGKQA